MYQSRSIAVAKGSKVPAAPKIQYFKKNVYAGAGVNVLRSVAVNGVFWLLFEKGRKITDTMG